MKLQRSINIRKTVNIKLCQNREINHEIKLSDDTEIIKNNKNKYERNHLAFFCELRLNK